MHKQNELKWSKSIIEEQIKFTQPEIMLKLISTKDERGWPHITLISSNHIVDDNTLVWGAFAEGSSKEYVKDDPKQGILYMTTDTPFKFMQVKADFTHTKKDGEELEYFNRTELMRYFTYVRVHTAYFNEIVSSRPIRGMGLGGILSGIIKNLIGKGGLKTVLDEKRLNPIGYDLYTAPIAVRAIAYIDPNDGYPVIIPCIPLQAADHNRLVFPLSSNKDDLLQIPEGSKVAVHCMNFDFANQVVKGTYIGISKSRLIKFGVIEIEEIYNSCPPVFGTIYPEDRKYERPKVVDFHL